MTEVLLRLRWAAIVCATAPACAAAAGRGDWAAATITVLAGCFWVLGGKLRPWNVSLSFVVLALVSAWYALSGLFRWSDGVVLSLVLLGWDLDRFLWRLAQVEWNVDHRQALRQLFTRHLIGLGCVLGLSAPLVALAVLLETTPALWMALCLTFGAVLAVAGTVRALRKSA